MDGTCRRKLVAYYRIARFSREGNMTSYFTETNVLDETHSLCNLIWLQEKLCGWRRCHSTLPKGSPLGSVSSSPLLCLHTFLGRFWLSGKLWDRSKSKTTKNVPPFYCLCRNRNAHLVCVRFIVAIGTVFSVRCSAGFYRSELKHAKLVFNKMTYNILRLAFF